MGQTEDREIKETRFWAKILLGAFLVPTIGGFVWVGNIESRVSQAEKDIAQNKTDIRGVTDDIRNILIGIEQVKARLGIIEKD